jgi:hypothetical protein
MDPRGDPLQGGIAALVDIRQNNPAEQSGRAYPAVIPEEYLAAQHHPLKGNPLQSVWNHLIMNLSR